MKDWEPFKPFVFPVGSGKGADKVLGDKALFTLGGSDGFRTRIVPLPTGGQLRVRTKNGMPEYTYEPVRTTESVEPSVSMKVIATLTAELAGLYMTSGAYTFGALGGINQSDPMLTVEPVTYKSASVASVESSELVSLYGKTPPNSGEVSKIYNHTVNPGGLNSPKAAMWNSRPSEFSGLMRRCMQGRYGIGNTSYDMTLPEAGGGINVGSTFGRTTGILRFGTKYFFVAITSGGGGMYGFYYPLHFPEDVSGLMVGAYSEAIETLCLAYAYVDPTEEAFFGNYDIAYGEPISYGWLFSLTTNKATCVVNEMLAYGYDRRMYRLMSLSFGYDEETNLVSLTYSLDEEVDGWIVPAQAPIWSPAGGESIWYNYRSNSPVPTSAQNFPVHSFYVGDELNVVRWAWSSASVTGNRTAHQTAVSNQQWENSIFGEGSTSYDVKTPYGTVVTHGFYIAGKTSTLISGSSYWRNFGSGTITYNEPVVSGIGTFASESAYRFWFNPDVETSNNPRISPWGSSDLLLGTSYPPDLHPGNHWSYYERRTGASSRMTVDESGSENHSSALVIPAKDCSAAYIGRKQTRNASRSVATASGTTNAQAIVQEWNCVQIKDKDGKVIGFSIAEKWCADVKCQFSLVRPSRWGSVSSGIYTEPVSDQNIAIELHTDVGLVVGGADSEIFYPGALRTKLLQQVQVISSSLYDDKRYNTETLSGGETAATSGYPTNITLFVGAS